MTFLHETQTDPLADTGQPKILMVDDRDENLFALERILASLGADIHKASSGTQALSRVLHHQYAVILMDVQMPELDGFETVSLIHEHDETRRVPVIFVTALNTEQRYIQRGFETGAVDYLTKPLDPDILRAKVRVFVDMERQKQELQTAMAEVRSLARRNELILESAGEGILSLDGEGDIVTVNPAACRMLRLTSKELDKQPLNHILYARSKGVRPMPWPATALYRSLQAGLTHRAKSEVFWRGDGSSFPVEYSCTRLGDNSDMADGAVMVFQDITQRQWAEEELSRLANQDPLTGVANRSVFQQFLDSNLSRARRNNEILSVLFLDLDHFKRINDRFGHDVGDQLLISVTELLQSCVRDSDLLARLGGDEFAIVLCNLKSASDSRTVVEKIFNAFEPLLVLSGAEINVQTSIGIATYPQSGSNGEELIKAADTAMYQAKATGRNNYQFFQPELQRKAIERSRLESDLRGALARDEFICHFQPQVDAHTGAVLGVETLLRWHHKERGMVPPDEFIEATERNGLIVPIGEWVIEQSCLKGVEWRDAGLLDDSFRIAVNVSVHQLMKGELVATVERVLQSTGFSADQLELEITESMVIDDPERVVGILQSLRDLGVTIAMDDFGTGYSSLSQLTRLPISQLKIDQAFVRDIGIDKNDEEIVTATVKLAHSLGLEVTAEGVETEEQADFLKALDCERLQGYYFSKPLPSDEAERWLSVHSGRGEDH